MFIGYRFQFTFISEHIMKSVEVNRAYVVFELRTVTSLRQSVGHHESFVKVFVGEVSFLSALSK